LLLIYNVPRKAQKYFVANFHFLGLFITKKRVYSEKKISVCHGGFRTKFEAQLAQPCLVLESWNFGYKPHLSQLGVPHTQNFEILKFLEKLRSQKKLNQFWKVSKNARYGSKFGKRCLFGISIQNLFQIRKILNFLDENLEFFLKSGKKCV
jgi:hypothetical protein